MAAEDRSQPVLLAGMVTWLSDKLHSFSHIPNS
ncbi:uncharacterized protein G2W53_022778 [Senna tora]|uniref:Uncharacterized protein n=1 Tax=Senna tora TaxID=362788 RepID=A0A834TNG0_9FABA|nr:uncharacterized protein G2W53_022778 [Senna tora]